MFYLIFILLLPLATSIRSQLIVSGDAAATAQKIMANELLFRISFMTELVSALFFVLAAWALYALLRSVNKDLALLFLLLNLCGVAIECVSVLNLSAALSLLSGADYLTVFPADQLQAQALLHIDMYDDGFMMAQLFFGAWLLPLGYLVYRSGFLPRAVRHLADHRLLRRADMVHTVLPAPRGRCHILPRLGGGFHRRGLADIVASGQGSEG